MICVIIPLFFIIRPPDRDLRSGGRMAFGGGMEEKFPDLHEKIVIGRSFWYNEKNTARAGGGKVSAAAPE